MRSEYTTLVENAVERRYLEGQDVDNIKTDLKNRA